MAHLQSQVEKAQSAVHIWKIRKASLAILNQVLRVFRLEGYSELATAICVSLV